MKERLRDKSRDGLAYALNSVGVKAEMAERKRAEKNTKSWHNRSLGIIDIPEGLIKWINILKKHGSEDSRPRWWIILGIPDERPISNCRMIKIKTVRE